MDEPIRRVLVTGAQGFLGRHVVNTLLDFHHKAKILGIGRSSYMQEAFTHSIRWATKRIPAPVPAYLRLNENQEGYEYAALDLQHKSATTDLIREFQPDVVIHLASGLRGDSVEDLMRIGVEGTVSLLEALAGLKKTKVRFICGSSGGVYGCVPESLLPIREDTATAPADLYALVKLTSEHACRILGQMNGIEVIYARLFNLVGPGQDERHVCGRFAAQAAAISLGLQFEVLQTGDLESTRDFIDVRDGARAIVLLAERARAGEIYNIASGKETAIGSILTTILEQAGLGNRVRVQRGGGPPTAVRRHVGCTARLRSLGFQREHSIEASLRDLLNYYLFEVSQFASERKRSTRVPT
jgi:nucleoside-diphosphate-sugar epimerase